MVQIYTDWISLKYYVKSTYTYLKECKYHFIILVTSVEIYTENLHRKQAHMNSVSHHASISISITVGDRTETWSSNGHVFDILLNHIMFPNYCNTCHFFGNILYYKGLPIYSETVQLGPLSTRPHKLTYFYPTALKGCRDIVFSHAVRLSGWAGGAKSLSRLYLRNCKV